jgi:SAM-dependent methyltransferase
MWGAEPNVFLAEAVGVLEPGKALDLACGDGRNARWLAGLGWTVTAVDFSDVAIERAREVSAEAGLDIDFQIHDLTRWTPPRQAFDLVAVVNLQITHDLLGPVIQRAAAAVAPGGTLFVVGHHSDNLEGGVGGPQHPDVLYTDTDLVGWCDDLEVVSSRRAERTVETDDGPRSAIDAVVVARRPTS